MVHTTGAVLGRQTTSPNNLPASMAASVMLSRWGNKLHPTRIGSTVSGWVVITVVGVMADCSVPAFKKLSAEVLSEIADALEEVWSTLNFVFVNFWRQQFWHQHRWTYLHFCALSPRLYCFIVFTLMCTVWLITWLNSDWFLYRLTIAFEVTTIVLSQPH